ncbi:peptidase S1 [Hyphobacterium sp.]|uniref:peptidase S1 n=1 Tax=Hyphobacterium sp. TaxID=2004662 RepID=UPI003BACEEF5
MMLRSVLFALFAGLAALVTAGPAQAQQWSLDPSYGSISLSSGFTPDPHEIALQSGGSIDASVSLGGSCRGFIANAPQFRLTYIARTWPLILSVNSDADTTLIVNGPDGRWYCDDDSGSGLNPALRWDQPQSGQYDIYVGTYQAASYHEATLSISELTSY